MHHFTPPKWVTILFITFSLAGIAQEKQPNILFIFSDDHAVQSIGAYGSKINKTPNIDRLAKMGAVFQNSFCTNSICGPSRASILTSKHSHKNGFYMNAGGASFDGGQWTFPKVLQKNGYQTAIIGKWHLKSDPTGFDHWDILPGQGSYYNPVFYGPDHKMKRVEGYVTDITTDKAINWLEKRDKNKPFLMMCQHKAPHRTFAPPLRYLNKYKNDIPEPETLFDNYENRIDMLKKNKMSIKDHFYYAYDLKVRQEVPFATKRERALKDSEYRRMTDEQKKVWDAHFKPLNDAFVKSAPKGKDLIRWKYQRYIKNYLGCVDAVDDSVGNLLEYLEKEGIADNTIVVYSSDQGFYLGEHGWYDKRWMYEESLKMPFIIKWPGVIPPGSKPQQLVQNIDYAPTFLDACGVTFDSKETQGQSIRPLFKEEKPNWRDAIYYHYYEAPGEHGVARQEGVRSDRYKLIHFYWNDTYNLHDLERDPLELKSVHDDPEYSKILLKMQKLLSEKRREFDSPQNMDNKEWREFMKKEKQLQKKRQQKIKK